MLPSSFYRIKNVYRLRHAFIATVVVVPLACACLTTATILHAQRLWKTQKSLRDLQNESAKPARPAHASPDAGVLLTGGMDAFAVSLAEWADERAVRVESIAPEGLQQEIEVTIEGTSLGKWKADQIAVQGRGRYEDVMSLIRRLRNSRMPVGLNSFSIDAFGDGSDGVVQFILQLTVHEPARGET